MNNYRGTFEEAPMSGRILAYTSGRVIYSAYRLQDGKIVIPDGELDLTGIYELHLFNADCEFRAICEDGEWKANTMCAASEPTDDPDHFVFRETQFLEERYHVVPDEKIVVNNYFSFDDEGFLRLTGYRLATEK